MQNEPNSNQSPAVLTCSSATLLTYSGQTLRKKCCASSSLRPKQHTFTQTRTKICKTNPIYPLFRPKTTMMIKNEPNSNPIRTQFVPIDCCPGLQFGLFLHTPAKPCVKNVVPHPASGQNSKTFPGHEPRSKICKTNPILKTLKLT